VDAAGNLYINDSNNYRIREVSNGLITTVAVTALRHRAAMAASPSRPHVAGRNGLRFRRRSLRQRFRPHREISGGHHPYHRGHSTPGDSADYLPALTAALNPGALLVDAADDIYFSESDGRVRVLRPQSGACATYSWRIRS